MKSPDLDPDNLDMVERELFRSLSGDDPPKRAHRAAAAALGLGSATLTSATAGGASVGAKAGALFAAKSGTLLLVKWVGIGTLAGAVSVGAIRYAQRPSPAPNAVARLAPAAGADSLARTQRSAPLSPLSPSSPSSPETAGEPVAEPARTEPIAPPVAAPVAFAGTQPIPAEPAAVVNQQTPASTMAARRAAPMPLQAAPRAAAPEAPMDDTATSGHANRPVSTLAAEVASLDEVRRAIGAKDGERALAQLRRHAREFPAATLNLEATVLHIEALFLAGSSDAARGMARDFLAAHPTSTHASRVRHLLAEHEKP